MPSTSLAWGLELCGVYEQYLRSKQNQRGYRRMSVFRTRLEGRFVTIVEELEKPRGIEGALLWPNIHQGHGRNIEQLPLVFPGNPKDAPKVKLTMLYNEERWRSREQRLYLLVSGEAGPVVVVAEEVHRQRSRKKHKFSELVEGLPWYAGSWLLQGNVAPLQAMCDAARTAHFRKAISGEWADLHWISCFTRALGFVLTQNPKQESYCYPSILPNVCLVGLKTYL